MAATNVKTLALRCSTGNGERSPLGIDCAFVYGSIARREEESESDVDMLVIGRIRLVDLSAALKETGEKIGRSVNPTVYRAEEFARKFVAGEHFLGTLMRQAKLYLIGDGNKLAETSGGRLGAKASYKQKRASSAARRR